MPSQFWENILITHFSVVRSLQHSRPASRAFIPSSPSLLSVRLNKQGATVIHTMPSVANIIAKNVLASVIVSDRKMASELALYPDLPAYMQTFTCNYFLPFKKREGLVDLVMSHGCDL